MKRTILAILFLGFLANVSGQPVDWYKLDDGKTASGYTDLGRIQRDNFGAQTFRAWWHIAYKSSQSYRGLAYDDILSLYRVDCTTGGLTSLQTTAKDLKGQVIWQTGFQPETIALPDSKGEEFVRVVCTHAKAARL